MRVFVPGKLHFHPFRFHLTELKPTGTMYTWPIPWPNFCHGRHRGSPINPGDINGFATVLQHNHLPTISLYRSESHHAGISWPMTKPNFPHHHVLTYLSRYFAGIRFATFCQQILLFLGFGWVLSPGCHFYIWPGSWPSFSKKNIFDLIHQLYCLVNFCDLKSQTGLAFFGYFDFDTVTSATSHLTSGPSLIVIRCSR